MKVLKLKKNGEPVTISIEPKLLYDGYLTQGGSYQLEDLKKFKFIEIIVYANGCYSSIRLPTETLGDFGVTWQACDNRLATYYLGGKINVSGLIQVYHTGYFRIDSTVDYVREYYIRKIYGWY